MTSQAGPRSPNCNPWNPKTKFCTYPMCEADWTSMILNPDEEPACGVNWAFATTLGPSQKSIFADLWNGATWAENRAKELGFVKDGAYSYNCGGMSVSTLSRDVCSTSSRL